MQRRADGHAQQYLLRAGHGGGGNRSPGGTVNSTMTDVHMPARRSTRSRAIAAVSPTATASIVTGPAPGMTSATAVATATPMRVATTRHASVRLVSPSFSCDTTSADTLAQIGWSRCSASATTSASTAAPVHRITKAAARIASAQTDEP